MNKYLQLLSLFGVLLISNLPIQANKPSPNLVCPICPSGSTCVQGEGCQQTINLSLLKKIQDSSQKVKVIALDTKDIFMCPNGKQIKFINNTSHFHCE